MPRARWVIAFFGAILVVGAVPAYFLGVRLWADWERDNAQELAARVLESFAPPCSAKGIDLSCEVPVAAMPIGAYSFIVVDSLPFEGVYLRARYIDGSEVAIVVVPKMFGISKAVVLEVASKQAA